MAANQLTGQTEIGDPLARALMRMSMNERPMSSPWDLAGRLAQFGVGSWLEKSHQDEQTAELAKALAGLPGLGDATKAAPATTPGDTPAAAATPGPRPEAPPTAPGAPTRDIAAAHQPGKPSAPAIPKPNTAIVLEAAQRVGVDPAYLTRLTGHESGGDPNIKSDTGAAGLGQFLPGTWKTYIAKYGHLYGYGPETPPTDAKANALMTAHYTKDSMAAFRQQHGKDAGPGELYAMHFLGQEGAGKLFAALKTNPNATTAQLYPELMQGPRLPDGRPNPRYSPTNIAALTANGQPLTAGALMQRLQGIVGGPQLAQATPGAPSAAPASDTPRPGAPTPLAPGAAPPPPAGNAPMIPPEDATRIKSMLASKNPQVRALGLQLYQTYAANAAAGNKPTDEMREYALYQKEETASGRKPLSFFDYKIKIKSAGTNQFSVNTPPAEKAADVESAKLAAKRLSDLGEAADQANKMVPAVMRIGALLDRVQTGKFAPAKITIGQYAKSIGVDPGALGFTGQELVDAETLRSLMIAQVTSIAKTLGANPTNYDAQLLAQQVANLENTPEGNRQIMKTTKDAIDFARRYETAASAYFKKNSNLHGFAEEFGAKEDERRRKAGLPTFSDEPAVPPPPAPGAPPPATGAPATPKQGAAPPPDAQGRRWAQDALGRRYYTTDGKSWFDASGKPQQFGTPQ